MDFDTETFPWCVYRPCTWVSDWGRTRHSCVLWTLPDAHRNWTPRAGALGANSRERQSRTLRAGRSAPNGARAARRTDRAKDSMVMSSTTAQERRRTQLARCSPPTELEQRITAGVTDPASAQAKRNFPQARLPTPDISSLRLRDTVLHFSTSTPTGIVAVELWKCVQEGQQICFEELVRRATG